MDQIRQLRFEDFKEEKLQQGYREVLERRWDPNIENEFHRHEFTADAIVIEGEFWLTVEGKTRHLNPGDSFHVPAQVEHKEKYGLQDVFLGSESLIHGNSINLLLDNLQLTIINSKASPTIKLDVGVGI